MVNVSDTAEVRDHGFKSCFQALISQLLLNVVHVTAMITRVLIENLLSRKFSNKRHPLSAPFRICVTMLIMRTCNSHVNE